MDTVTVDMPSISISLDQLSIMISTAVSSEDFPHLVMKADLDYEDVEVTQKTIEILLSSVREEFVTSGDKKELDKFDKLVENLCDMLDEFN